LKCSLIRVTRSLIEGPAFAGPGLALPHHLGNHRVCRSIFCVSAILAIPGGYDVGRPEVPGWRSQAPAGAVEFAERFHEGAIMTSRALFVVATIGVMAQVGSAQQAPGPAPARVPAVRSPEVHPDHRVTFRIRAPKATDVAVVGEFEVGAHPHPMQKDAQGVWSVTLGPFDPESYEYDFRVDGVQTIDPRNPAVKYNRAPADISSLLEIPASAPRFFDVKPVPHGKVDIRFYESKTTASTHRIHVYTPPGYDKMSRLPVLYLLHGADGEDSVWTAFGRVNTILDNLLAEKKIQPMVVVMPNGYAYGWESGVSADKQQADFQKLLIDDLIPWIQANYHVSTDRKQRALAGLSRGGSQTLSIGLRHLETFSRLGVFSAGSNNPQEAFKDVVANLPKVKEQLDLLWMQAGNDDFAMPGAKRFSEFMTANSVTHSFKTRPGEHTWIVWRNCLYEFAPLLWAPKRQGS
jgi:enterochelin esterase-like enzyme